LLSVCGALAKNGSFGFAKRWLVCRAKPNVLFTHLILFLFYGVRDSLRLIVRWLFLLFLYAAKISLSYFWFVCLFTLTDNGLQLHAGRDFYHKT
jgi:hypothetical protein